MLKRNFATTFLRKRSHCADALVELSSGQRFNGKSFGADRSVSGELVFTTSLVGYPESLSDPSYRGQILVFTQPLIGNYGVPRMTLDKYGLPAHFESNKIQAAGLIVANYSEKFSHWNADISLSDWCVRENVPLISDVDTRELTKILRDQGSSLGRITIGGDQNSSIPAPFVNPNTENLVQQVSTKEILVFNPSGTYKIGLIDCGAKFNIIRRLCDLDAQVHLLPWNYDPSSDPSYDGFFISNGPGSPTTCPETVEIVRKLLQQSRPVYGICMGNLLMGLAAGYQVKKLRFGNRSHNQAALNLVDGTYVMTSQNHGFALVDENGPKEWRTFYKNIHDGSNEGIMHLHKPFKAVQFHPEAKGGPLDTQHFFYEFMEAVKHVNSGNKTL